MEFTLNNEQGILQIEQRTKNRPLFVRSDIISSILNHSIYYIIILENFMCTYVRKSYNTIFEFFIFYDYIMQCTHIPMYVPTDIL